MARETVLPEAERMELHFAFGKVYDDIGDHQKAFKHFAEGNHLKRQALSYDEAATLGQLAHIKETFTPALMDRLKGGGQSSSLPIFVVGMPRSGTTLVSEILASHSRAFCVGEIGEFGRAIARQRPSNRPLENDEWVTETLPTPTSSFLEDVGHRYLKGLIARAPATDRIIDKLTLNFRYAGLIHLALSGARIIHVRRNALDTCLSCYFSLFLGAHPYSYDLAELGRYYRGYETLMDHWRQTLPAGVMLEVNYEDLVGNLEGEARRMIDHCGLDWDPACLRFHEGQRWVRTASAVQVRQPLYATSIDRYKFYDPHLLQPLMSALGQAAGGAEGLRARA